MLEIYEIFDGGQDGTDSSRICFVTTHDLAETIAEGRGAMGHGNGEIVPHQLYDSVDDLPPEIKGRVKERLRQKNADFQKLKELLDKHNLSNLPTEDQILLKKYFSGE